MKTYVLTISKIFPTTHKRKGQETGFIEAIQNLFDLNKKATKIHTIRANYDFWKKRIDKINNGEAILSVRYWSGKPYSSKQIELATFRGVGIQKIDFSDDYLYSVRIDGRRFSFSSEMIPENDGLSDSDFEDWFRKYDLSKPMAIIHFTNFRY